jgi:hypothetical protein
VTAREHAKILAFACDFWYNKLNFVISYQTDGWIPLSCFLCLLLLLQQKQQGSPNQSVELAALREQCSNHAKERAALKTILDAKIRSLVEEISKSITSLPPEVSRNYVDCDVCVEIDLESKYKPCGNYMGL